MGFQENKNLRLLNSSYRKDINKIKFSAANTLTHELVKAAICHILLTRKESFVTEAIFNKGRADVFSLTTGNVYEVLYSEKLETFAKKKSYYPQEINEIIAINARDFIKDIDSPNLINKLSPKLI